MASLRLTVLSPNPPNSQGSRVGTNPLLHEAPALRHLLCHPDHESYISSLICRQSPAGRGHLWHQASPWVWQNDDP